MVFLIRILWHTTVQKFEITDFVFKEIKTFI